MKKVIILFYFLPGVVFADTNYYCANTNQSISLGQTMGEVQLACGAPTTMNTQQQTIANSTLGEQWIYTRGSITSTPQGVITSQNVPSLIFTIQNGMVTQIQRSGTMISGGITCGVAQIIGINSTAAAVRIACGTPNYIQPYQQSNPVTHTITTWIYNHGPFQPQIILTFTDNKLTTIQSGQLGR